MTQPIEFRPLERGDHTILVVDDDPVSRYTTVRWLQKAGFQTLEASTGREGLALATSDISAMVLDVHLPDVNGFDLCRTIRSRPDPQYLPVLHLSAAHITDEDKVKGLDSGADAYLTHPVDPTVLVATVQALVRTRVAEDALRRSEEQFRAVYDRSPEGIALLDLEGQVVEANPAMLDFLGRPVSQVIGRSIQALAGDEAQVFAKPGSPSGAEDQFAIVRPDGSALQVKWTLLPLVRPGLNMLLANDMTAPVQLEEQREMALQRERSARAEAERVSRLKDEFIAVLSHELRSPLTAIMGWVHIFKRGLLDATRQKQGFESIERNVMLQARLVSDLLDMSSINLGKMRLSLAEVSIPDVVRSAVEAAQASLDKKHLRVDMLVEASCPTVRADPARVQQIASNVLGNAIKFSREGGEIKITVTPDDAGVRISFADKGTGISKEFLPNLFDRFSQADASSNRRHGGLGLGLSIVRHLVESHEGSVSVDSAGLGLGATFSVWLPLAGPRGEQASKFAADDEMPGNADATLRGVSLLVVDDDPDVCETLSLILRDRGAVVRVANSHDAALAEIAKQRPDVLLSDIGMPGKDGYALIASIRQAETDEHLPVVAITSYAREQDKAFALASGFDAHCSKPVRAVDLVHIVQSLIAG